MRHYTFLWLGITALLLSACAQQQTDSIGRLNNMEFEAWVAMNKDNSWKETELGSWVLYMDKGDESRNISSIEDNPYLRLEYTVTDLDGTIVETTSETISKRLGDYDKRNYYGPQFSYRGSNSTFAGIEELFTDMGIGGKCKAVIPGWLLTNSRYNTKQQYINAMSSSTEARIYEFSITESVKDTEEWEMALLEKAMGSEWEDADSLTTGVYYVQDKASDKPDTTFTSSAQIYINYICRRIDGTGIDTNIADSAKVFGGTASGEPVLINWGEKATDLTMTSNKTSVVKGFAYGIFNMKPHEKGRVYMTSSSAYGASGSGSAIPAYCPIYFEIEIVDKDE